MTEALDLHVDREQREYRGRMSSAGIPRHLWEVSPTRPATGTEWPTGSALKVLERFEEKAESFYTRPIHTVVSGGSLMDREQVVAWMARCALQSDNRFYRYGGESKHQEAGDPVPFTVKMVDMGDLEELYKGDDFEGAVMEYDFFFLREVGREYASSFTARMLMDLLAIRVGEELPLTITLERDLDRIDKDGGSPYREVEDFVEANFEGKVIL